MGRLSVCAPSSRVAALVVSMSAFLSVWAGSVPQREIAFEGGTLLAPRVRLAAAPSDGELWLAYGLSDGGDTTNGWDHVQHVQTVPAAETTIDVELPEGIGVDYTYYRFFVLYDSTRAYATHLVESVTASTASQHIDTGVVINALTMPKTRVSITMSAPSSTWPVNGIAGDRNLAYFFCGPGQNGVIHYGGGDNAGGNKSTGVTYSWGHKDTFDLDFLNKTYVVTDWDATPATVVVNQSVDYRDAPGTATFWLFGYNGEKAERTMTIYSADFWQDGELVASMIPAVSNGLACVYDTYRKKYLLPMNKNETSVSTALTAGAFVAPEDSSTPTRHFEYTAKPEISLLGFASENELPHVRGALLYCGDDATVCDLFVRYGFASNRLEHAVRIATSAELGDFDIPVPALLPQRPYWAAVEAVNVNSQTGVSDVVSFCFAAADAGDVGARDFSVAGLTFADGLPTQARLAFAQGTEGQLSQYGNGIHVGEDEAVSTDAQDVTVGLPRDPVTALPYPQLEFRFAGRLSDVYGHLVEHVSSQPASLTRGCLDTGVTVTPGSYRTTRMRITFSTAERNAWNVVGYSEKEGLFFGGVDNAGGIACGFGRGGNQWVIGEKYNYSDVLTFDLDGENLKCTVFNETTRKTVAQKDLPDSAPNGNMPLSFHGWNQFYRRQTVYRAQFWQSGKLVRDFHPCVDKSGVACYFDSVTKTLFHGNGGGSELTAGEEIADAAVRRRYLYSAAVDAPCIASAEADCDPSSGNSRVRGLVSQFGSAMASDCTLSLTLMCDGERDERTLGCPGPDGSFAFDLAGLRPDSDYAWILCATSSSGRHDVVTGPGFRTLGTTKLKDVSVTALQHELTATVAFDSFGAGETLLYAFWGEGETPDHSVLLGRYEPTSSKLQIVSFRAEGVTRDVEVNYQIVASNFVGTASATSVSLPGTVPIRDLATYTWRTGVSGRWTDAASWDCSTDDNWGYPNGSNCKAAFAAGRADVELDAHVKVNGLLFSGDAPDVRIHAANTNDFSLTCPLLADMSLPARMRWTVDRAKILIERSGPNMSPLYVGASGAVVITNGAYFSTTYFKAMADESRIVICDGAVVNTQDFSLGDGELVVDDGLAYCQSMFLNNDIDKHDKARVLIRGRNPRMIWNRSTTSMAANTSQCRPARLDFEIPSGGYASTPLDCGIALNDYPFGDFDKYPGFAGRSTNIMVRVVNRRETFLSIPKRQQLIRWSPAGIMTNRIDLLPTARSRSRLCYGDEGERPTTLELVNERPGMAIILK